ncbi:MAG: hypothetical protein R6X33_02920 [Candidatus Brocadiia bacterium]
MKTTPRSLTALPALLSMLLGVAGCAGPPPPQPRPPSRDVALERMVVVEFHDRTRYSSHDYAADLTRALAEKLTDWTSATDVVVVSRQDIGAGTDPFVSGRMPLDVLVRARNDYLADAVVIGTLSEMDPYRPVSATVGLKIVETGDGRVLFSVAERWDAAEHGVRQRIKAYYRRNSDAPDCRFGPDIFLNSPRYFLRFVADQVAYRASREL